MSETVMAKHFAEAFAEALGEPLPADWQDELACQARRDRLAALAYSVADAATAAIMRQAEAQQRGERLTVGDPAVSSFVDAMLELDHGWRAHVRAGQTGAAEIVYNAADFWAGPLIATYVEGTLEKMHDAELRVMRELHPDV
ncbi:MAG TPA: hypothetical protein VGM07_08535 [Stellaceae bacterium]